MLERMRIDLREKKEEDGEEIQKQDRFSYLINEVGRMMKHLNKAVPHYKSNSLMRFNDIAVVKCAHVASVH